MLTVKLYGVLRDLCGGQRSVLLDVRSPAEAVRALSVLFPRLRPWLVGAGRAVPIRVAGTLPGRRPVGYTADTLHNPQGHGVLRLVPQPAGAGGNGGLQMILGAVIAGVSYYFGFTPGIQIGMSMMLGGAAALLAAHLAPSASQQNSVENQPSYSFNGAVNTTGQGGPVPLCYGRLQIGSQIAGVGFSTNNERLVVLGIGLY